MSQATPTPSRIEAQEYASPPTETAGVSSSPIWIGRVLSVLVAALLIFSAVMKFVQPPGVDDGFEHLGIPMRLAVAIGVVEVAVAVLYLIPQTAVLGGILVAAYLGGATLTHLRVGDPWFMPPILGVVAWIALYLRDARLRALVPMRKLSVSAFPLCSRSTGTDEMPVATDRLK